MLATAPLRRRLQRCINGARVVSARRRWRGIQGAIFLRAAAHAYLMIIIQCEGVAHTFADESITATMIQALSLPGEFPGCCPYLLVLVRLIVLIMSSDSDYDQCMGASGQHGRADDHSDGESASDPDEIKDVADADCVASGCSDSRHFVRSPGDCAGERAAAGVWEHVFAAEHGTCQKPSERLRGQTLNVVYGSDASGVDAPLFALRDISEELSKHDIKLAVDSVFASEHPGNFAAQRFLKQNHKPKVLYIDMFARNHAGGIDDIGARVPLPEPFTVGMYTAGTDCTSITSANRQSEQIRFDWSAIDSGNKSTRAMLQSIRTLRALQAITFLFENVKQLDAGALIKFLRRNLPGYCICAHRSNAADMGTSSERDRWCVVGARKEAIVIPVSLWPHMIDACSTCRVARDPTDLLLSAESPEVGAEFTRKTNRTNGHLQVEGTCKWMTEHKRIDAALRPRELKSGADRMDTSPMALASPIKVADAAAWFRALSPRLRGLASLCARWVDDDHVKYPPPPRGEYYYFFDVDAPATHARLLYPGISPVLLRRHYVVVILKSLGKRAVVLRHLLGLEHLFLLGIPRGINVSRITDYQLRSLAGNSMAVPWLVAVLSVLVASVDFSVKPCPMVCTDADFVLHTMDSHPGSPYASKLKKAMPGFSASSRRQARATVLSFWDIRPMARSDAQLAVPPSAAANQAGHMCLELLADIGLNRVMQSYYKKSINGCRKVSTVLLGAANGAGKLNVVDPNVSDSPHRSMILKLASAIANAFDVQPHWMDLQISHAEPLGPIEVHGFCHPAVIMALPIDPEEAGPIGEWWRSAPQDASTCSPKDVAGSLGPLSFDLLPNASGRGRRQLLIGEGRSIAGFYIEGAIHVEVFPGQIAVFVPRRNVALCCARVMNDATLFSHGAAFARVGFVAESAVPRAVGAHEAHEDDMPAKRRRRAPPKQVHPRKKQRQSTLPPLEPCQSDGRNWVSPQPLVPSAKASVELCAVDSDSGDDLEACMQAAGA